MTPRALLSLIVALIVSTLCADVYAQTVAPTLTLGTVITRRADRPSGLDLKTITYADCVADDFIGVALTATNAGSTSLQVWVGTTTDCSPDATRMLAANVPSLCWEAYTQTVLPTTTINLKVRDLLPHQMFGGGTGQNSGTADECDYIADPANGTGNGTITVFFIAVNGDAMAANTTLPLTFDLQGPPAPTGITLGIGDTRLFPTWSAPMSTGDTLGYQVYCDDTGQMSDPTSSTITDCMSANLATGKVPPSTVTVAGTASLTATSAEASGLTNGEIYACGVAGYDKYNNVGPLSELVCGSPKPVNGYFKVYRLAGGQGGGGFCSFGRGSHAGAAVAGALSLVGLFWARRGRRSRRSGRRNAELGSASAKS